MGKEPVCRKWSSQPRLLCSQGNEIEAIHWQGVTMGTSRTQSTHKLGSKLAQIREALLANSSHLIFRSEP